MEADGKTEGEHIEPALYLIPNTLGDAPLDRAFPPFNALLVRHIRHFIVESRKPAVRLLSRLCADFPADECEFAELSEHTARNADLSRLLLPLERGEPMGVISDAGCPAVGDPGSRAVALAHKKRLTVVPLVGPNAMLLALMSSGLNGQNFAFNGYLPAKPGEREAAIRRLESRARKEKQTQLFIETPYRNQKLFDALIKTCRADTRLCVAQGLTTADELIRTKKIADWKASSPPAFEKIPAMFLICP